MSKYKATNETDNETLYFKAESDREARTYVQNYADHSKGAWTYEKVRSTREADRLAEKFLKRMRKQSRVINNI